MLTGAAVHRSVLFVKSCVGSGSVIEDSLLLPDCRVGRGCHIRNAIIDAGCVIPDGMTVGVNPKADAHRFYRSPRGITLVTRAMLERVATAVKSAFRQQRQTPVSSNAVDESTVELHSKVSRMERAALEPLSGQGDWVRGGRRSRARKS